MNRGNLDGLRWEGGIAGPLPHITPPLSEGGLGRRDQSGTASVYTTMGTPLIPSSGVGVNTTVTATTTMGRANLGMCWLDQSLAFTSFSLWFANGTAGLAMDWVIYSVGQDSLPAELVATRPGFQAATGANTRNQIQLLQVPRSGWYYAGIHVAGVANTVNVGGCRPLYGPSYNSAETQGGSIGIGFEYPSTATTEFKQGNPPRDVSSYKLATGSGGAANAMFPQVSGAPAITYRTA